MGPLPPRGPLAFVCAWPGRRIKAKREVDAEAILEAANAAVTFWPDGPFYSEDY